MIQLSTISQQIQPSLTRHLFNLAKQYDDVIDFTLGDPDIQPHQAIKNAGCLAIQQGKTRYSQNAGLLSLRETICHYYERKEGLCFNPSHEVIVTVGAMEGLYLTLLAIINPGDEVIIPAPYYVNYVQMVIMCHATPVIINGSGLDKFNLNVKDLEDAITPRTRAIIINNPSNPSAKLLSDYEMESLARIAQKNNLIVISDEVYKSLIYDDKTYKNIVGIDGMRERTIIVNSLSKEFCMTGYRIGYVFAPKEVISAMVKLQENIVACAPLPSQYAALEALSGKDDYSSKSVAIFKRRRDILLKGISEIPLLRCNVPEATFYLMVDISLTEMSSEVFALELLRSKHVALVPGIAYGADYDCYVRLAFTIDEKEILEGLDRIKLFIEQISL